MNKRVQAVMAAMALCCGAPLAAGVVRQRPAAAS
jgi:hypothetical protein